MRELAPPKSIQGTAKNAIEEMSTSPDGVPGFTPTIVRKILGGAVDGFSKLRVVPIATHLEQSPESNSTQIATLTIGRMLSSHLDDQLYAVKHFRESRSGAISEIQLLFKRPIGPSDSLGSLGSLEVISKTAQPFVGIDLTYDSKQNESGVAQATKKVILGRIRLLVPNANYAKSVAEANEKTKVTHLPSPYGFGNWQKGDYNPHHDDSHQCKFINIPNPFNESEIATLKSSAGRKLEKIVNIKGYTNVKFTISEDKSNFGDPIMKVEFYDANDKDFSQGAIIDFDIPVLMSLQK